MVKFLLSRSFLTHRASYTSDRERRHCWSSVIRAVDCVTLWIGSSLGRVERACLRSVLAQGHSVRLYCYDKPEGVPEGVETGDAADVLPLDPDFTRNSDRMAIFADWFRIEIQRRGLGTWIDSDLYLIGRLDLERVSLFGEQAPGEINNAVLRLPQDSPIIAPLLRIFELRTTPDWLRAHHYLASRIVELGRGHANLFALPWATTGPHALTALAKRFGLEGEALPSDVFYPVRWQDADWLLDPANSLDDVVTDRTVAVHLWNRHLAPFKDAPAPRGSFLERLQREGA